MRSIWIKLALFLILWYEVAAELRLDADRAFLLSVAMLVFGWFALRMSGQLVGLVGPMAHRLIVGAVAWLVLFWWFAPNILKSLPLVFILAGALGIAIGGARCRHWFEDNRGKLDKSYLREHSDAVVIVVFGTLGLVAFAFHVSGSIWPLIGCAAPPLLPFGFGWQMAGRLGPKRADAKFGDEASFRDAGLSEER